MKFSLRINAKTHFVDAEPRKLLSDVIREDCGLTGTHVGCEHGVCGACTVVIDGMPARSCLMFAIQAEGKSIATVEGLSQRRSLSALQQCFHEEHGLQCGFCTPGILMTLEAYLSDHPRPSSAELRDVLSGNLCRCTGYQNILRAALKFVAVRDIEEPDPW